MSPDEKKIRALPIDVYVRVSRVNEREGDSFISPAVQEERAKAMLVARGFEPGEVFTDLDQSGGKMNRPGFDEVMQRVREGKSGGVVVHKLDRFARNVRGLLEAVEEIEAHGAAFICVEPSLDTSDKAYGRFLLTLFGALAELELAKIKSSWGVTHEKHVARGVSTGRAPIGYRKREDGTLEPDPFTGPLITEVFQRRARGAKLTELADFLTEAGVQKASGKPWIDVDLGKILRNDVYLGVIKFGELRNEDAHQRLVDQETWWRCRQRESRTKHSVPGPGKGSHPLSGQVRCGGCGYRMSRSKTTSPKGEVYYYVRCKNTACKAPAGISERSLEELVYGRIAEEGVARFARPQERTADLEAARARVEEAEHRLATFEATWVAQGLDPADAISMRKPLVEEHEAAIQALTELPAESTDVWSALANPSVLETLRAQGIEVTQEQHEELLAKARASTEKLYDEGITAGKILERLTFPTNGDLPEDVSQAILAQKKEIIRQTLRGVTVTGKKGVPADRVKVELLA